MFKSVNRIHFVGIGGIGMSGIAEILLSQGFEVSGSDMAKSENTDRLEEQGAKIFIGHKAENIIGAEVVVFSSAVHIDDNPETLAAKQANIPIIRRAEMLAEVSRLNYCLAVSGTHGKTTTTSMCGLALMKAGIDPTVIVGGRLRGLGGANARLGKGEWTVVEADEFDRSFLQLSPTIAIVNNIEAEHLDIYKDIEDIKNTFVEFVNKIPFYGVAALCLDDPGVKQILSRVRKKYITFGESPHADYRITDISYSERSSTATVWERENRLGELKIHIPGLHNLKNALAAVAVGRAMGIAFETIIAALAEFTGVYRRFEILGERDGVLYVDDYAHHHTEVKASLKAARTGWKRRIVAVFQPHTYTRTRDFYEEFGQSFDDADVLFVSDVYPAREEPIEGVTGDLIANSAKMFGHKGVHYVQNINDVKEEVRKILKPNDLVITLGAGSVWKIAKELFEEKLIN